MVKSQSAMEYLMTYGWAILIIAVVLAVLFQLGVFSGGNFLPHAQAGACQVSRTIAGVSLEGQCNGMLPEFVAQFGDQVGSNVVVSEIGSYSIPGSITEAAWVNFQSVGSAINLGIITPGCNCNTYPLLFLQSGSQSFRYAIYVSPTVYWYDAGMTPKLNTWYFVVGTYNQNSGAVSIYINGVQPTGGSGSDAPAGSLQTEYGGGFAFGSFPAQGTYTDMQEANIQIYNTSLSSSEIMTLYQEGIGGAPIRPQNLVGWWPLNGNANDYSGNGNNGQLNGVTFSSAWEGSYTAP